MIPTLLDDLLDPLTHCFTPAVAQDVANLRFDKKVQTKLEDLRHKANEGTLTPEEQAEYETLTETIDFIAVLQAKSRQMVRQAASTSAPPDAVPTTILSARDRDLFLALLDNPPEPNEALRQAAQQYRERYGSTP